SEAELALLCWGGAGTNGLIRNDRTFAQNACTHPWFEGRVYPSACNVWYVHLIFATDEGIFLYRPHVPTRMVEVKTKEDTEIIFRAFKEGVLKLSDEPLWRAESAVASRTEKPKIAKTTYGTERMFQPGVTYFFPLVDITVELINIYMMLYSTGTALFDDETGTPAGVREWIDKGRLGAKKVPLSLYETGVFQTLIAHPYYIHQNLQLCAAAMGLGGYVTGGGYESLMVLHESLQKGGHGIRFATDKRGYSYPVGIDGVIETHMPPYLSMDEAVQDVWDMKFKGGYGRYSPDLREGDEVVYRGFGRRGRAVYRPFKEPEKYTEAARVDSRETVEVAKCVANYIYDTYGRFPKLFNPILCENFVQISHIDTEFYDRYYPEDGTWEEQREHMRLWHLKDQGRGQR
ncbi:MAG: hypothetical protein A2170_16715, partial [Deltaproteobacteria bacterium RBG_13_53_10]